jgi:hypothetical protein
MPQLSSSLPSFDGVSHWRNGPVPTEAGLAGKPVLVHFFSSGCPLCRDGMPVIRRLYSTYSAAGLMVVGAFQPRQDVKASLADAERECDLHIGPTHACALDAGGILAARLRARSRRPTMSTIAATIYGTIRWGIGISKRSAESFGR